MVGFVVTLLIEGLIGGVALRAVLPGEQNWTIGQTLAIGVVTWFLVGLALQVLVGAIVGLVLPLLVVGGLCLWVASRRRGGARRR